MRVQSLQSTALHYFLAVASHGSLAGASRALHVAASAISRQIAGLERNLGQPLFDRLPRGMVLTPAGDILADYARRMAQEADRALQDVLAIDDVHAGVVRVAASEGFAGYALPRTMAAFRERYPDVGFALEQVSPAAVSERLRAGEADIGIAYLRGAHEDVTIIHRQRAAARAIMGTDHPLAKQTHVTLRQIAAYPMAFPDHRTTLRHMLDAAFARLRMTPTPALVTNSMLALLAFVASGGGLTVLSEVSLQHLPAQSGVVAIPIKERLLPPREFGIQVQAGRTLPAAVVRFLPLLIAQLSADPCRFGKEIDDNQ